MEPVEPDVSEYWGVLARAGVEGEELHWDWEREGGGEKRLEMAERASLLLAPILPALLFGLVLSLVVSWAVASLASMAPMDSMTSLTSAGSRGPSWRSR